MLSDYADKNRYSFDESRNLSCVREYRVFQFFHLFRRFRLFEADPSPPFGLPPSPRGHASNDRASSVNMIFRNDNTTHSPVISSGGSMLHDIAAKNRYSFDESRNLSCGQDYRFFPP